ncbi:unnamed protein product [Polarella glacialis]|uniref:Uncharacterized protein n=1 Tax=Polarella glacialis TaxID=89957 RepID=A0A813GDQ1_POLGL|nr:unnamed protein product [Polarella glacialis]CAE8623152.1 unnamed protein product [Polarella glacialis]
MPSEDASPVGEGWTRHNAEMLLHPPSQVFFAQRGEQRGKYLLRSDDGSLSVCPAPHVSADCPLEVRAASACVLRPCPQTTEGSSASGRRSGPQDGAVSGPG